jgi:molybdopterin molybdotransferase
MSVDEALDRVLAAVSPLPAETVQLPDALGRVTAADIVASQDLPSVRNSAMDGYAVGSGDTARASAEQPVQLTVTGTIAAGDEPGFAVGQGQAIRIMTGAPIPDGADAIVRFEDTDERSRSGTSGMELSEIGVLRPVEPGTNVRPAGEDIAKGKLAVAAGTWLRPAEIGLLSGLGVHDVAVHRRPDVAILSTGNELVPPGAPVQAGQIRDSNSLMLAAFASQTGANPIAIGIARDEIADLSEKLRSCQSCDFIITSGGVSAGEYDMVKDVLHAEGSIDVWQVRMKPGKPLAFGWIGSIPFLGLPGNPVAAAVAFTQFAGPAIRTMLGLRDVMPETVTARLTESIDNSGQRRHYVRAMLERSEPNGYTVSAVGAQGAGVLTSLTRANALIVLPEEIERAEAGAMVQVQILH